jgi:hypothetical protein
MQKFYRSIDFLEKIPIFSTKVYFRWKSVWPDVFEKKSPNDHKNGPDNPPTYFIQLKFCPNHWAIFFLEKNRPMLKTFAQIAIFSQSGHNDFRRKSDFRRRCSD